MKPDSTTLIQQKIVSFLLTRSIHGKLRERELFGDDRVRNGVQRRRRGR